MHESSLRVAVVTSAEGSEHAVSLASGANVANALKLHYPEVDTFAFDASLAENLQAWRADLVVPVAHGFGGESGHLQNLLEKLAIPYVGSNAEASALCWNKALANQAVSGMLQCSLDHPLCGVPSFVVVERNDDVRSRIADFLNLPAAPALLVVKPVCEGSSVGVSFCTAPDYPFASRVELLLERPVAKQRWENILASINMAFRFDSSVMVQRAVIGHEVTVSILDDVVSSALPTIEIETPKGTWFDFEHKYGTGKSLHILPPRIPPELTQATEAYAVALHRQLGCRDLSRMDFIVEVTQTSEPRIWFLEANTLPGFTGTSLFPDAARSAGIAMPELVSRLVARAWGRRH